MNKKRLLDMLALLLIGSMYSWALAKSIIVSTVLVVDDWELFFLIVSFLLFFAVFFYNRITMLVALGVTMLAYFYFAYQFFWAEMPNEQILFLYETAIRSLQFARGYIPHEEIYADMILYVICFLLTFCASIFIYAGFNFFMLTAIAAVLIMLNLMSLFPMSDLAYIVFLFSYLLLMAKKLHKFNPVMIGMTSLSVLVAMCIPTPSTTKGESTGGLYDLIYDHVRPKYFSFQATGFTPSDRKLGGTAKPNGGYVMDVYTDQRVYLAGSTKNLYTGYSWEKENSETFLYDESAYFSGSLDDHETYGKVEINIGNNRTSTIFRPIHTTRVALADSAQNLYTDRYGDLQTEEFLARGSSYTLQYLTQEYLNWWEKRRRAGITVHEGDISVYNESQIMIENGWVTIHGDQEIEIKAEDLRLYLSGRGIAYHSEIRIPWGNGTYYVSYGEESMFQFEEDTQRAISDFVRQTIQSEQGIEPFEEREEMPNIDNRIYLNLPDELPERVIRLAQEITSMSERDYDKVKDIEQYLRENYGYTLSPSQVVEGDFVDHFLFEGKEGYCTYYASAMAVLTRAIGIPSRYVEGFVLPPTRNSSGSYTVTNVQAHAWAEVYLEGFGWAMFEPTPPYSDLFLRIEEDVESRFDAFLSSRLKESEEIPFGDRNMAQEQEEQESEARNSDTVFMPLDERTKSVFSPFFLALGLIVFSLIGLFVFNVVRRNWQEKRMKKLSNRELAIQYFKLFMEASSFLGYALKENETSLQYADRVSYSFETIALREAEKIFSKAKYGKDEITQAEWQKVQAIYLDMQALLRAKYAKPKWFYYRYILYKF